MENYKDKIKQRQLQSMDKNKSKFGDEVMIFHLLNFKNQMEDILDMIQNSKNFLLEFFQNENHLKIL